MAVNKDKLWNFVVIFLFLYLIFHTIYGNRGVIAYHKIEKEIEELTRKADELIFTRIILEKQVKSLNTKHIDRDLIDEIARKLLLLAEPDEEIIIRKRND
jgi:cell division protein FtsB